MSDDCQKCCEMVKAADQCPHARVVEAETVDCDHCGIHGQLADVIGAAHEECVGQFVDHEFVADRIADAVLSSGLVVSAAIHKVATDALEAGDACGAVGCRALVDRDRANDALDRAHELLVRTRRVVDLPATDPWDRGWRKAHLKIANELHSALDTTPRA